MFLLIYNCTLLLAAISIDAFTAGLSYGMEKVKIPFLSTLIMSALSGTLLFISLQAGNFLQDFFPQNFIKIFSFSILLILGLYKLFDTFISKAIKDVNGDDLTILSPKEAFFLGFALSLDNIAAGFGFRADSFSPILIACIAITVSFTVIRAGCLIGRKIAVHSSINLSWIGAVLILILAFSRLFQ